MATSSEDLSPNLVRFRHLFNSMPEPGDQWTASYNDGSNSLPVGCSCDEYGFHTSKCRTRLPCDLCGYETDINDHTGMESYGCECCDVQLCPHCVVMPFAGGTQAGERLKGEHQIIQSFSPGHVHFDDVVALFCISTSQLERITQNIGSARTGKRSARIKSVLLNVKKVCKNDPTAARKLLVDAGLDVYRCHSLNSICYELEEFRTLRPEVSASPQRKAELVQLKAELMLEKAVYVKKRAVQFIENQRGGHQDCERFCPSVCDSQKYALLCNDIRLLGSFIMDLSDVAATHHDPSHDLVDLNKSGADESDANESDADESDADESEADEGSEDIAIDSFSCARNGAISVGVRVVLQSFVDDAVSPQTTDERISNKLRQQSETAIADAEEKTKQVWERKIKEGKVVNDRRKQDAATELGKVYHTARKIVYSNFQKGYKLQDEELSLKKSWLTNTTDLYCRELPGYTNTPTIVEALITEISTMAEEDMLIVKNIQVSATDTMIVFGLYNDAVLSRCRTLEAHYQRTQLRWKKTKQEWEKSADCAALLARFNHTRSKNSKPKTVHNIGFKVMHSDARHHRSNDGTWYLGNYDTLQEANAAVRRDAVANGYPEHKIEGVPTMLTNEVLVENGGEYNDNDSDTYQAMYKSGKLTVVYDSGRQKSWVEERGTPIADVKKGALTLKWMNDKMVKGKVKMKVDDTTFEVLHENGVTERVSLEELRTFLVTIPAPKKKKTKDIPIDEEPCGSSNNESSDDDESSSSCIYLKEEQTTFARQMDTSESSLRASCAIAAAKTREKMIVKEQRREEHVTSLVSEWLQQHETWKHLRKELYEFMNALPLLANALPSVAVALPSVATVPLTVEPSDNRAAPDSVSVRKKGVVSTQKRKQQALAKPTTTTESITKTETTTTTDSITNASSVSACNKGTLSAPPIPSTNRSKPQVSLLPSNSTKAKVIPGHSPSQKPPQSLASRLVAVKPNAISRLKQEVDEQGCEISRLNDHVTALELRLEANAKAHACEIETLKQDMKQLQQVVRDALD